MSADLPTTVDTDRRELWWLENFLAVNATTDRQRERHRLLNRYLCETCVHDFRDASGWGGCPQGTHQCSWCNKPTFPNDADHRELMEASRLARADS